MKIINYPTFNMGDNSFLDSKALANEQKIPPQDDTMLINNDPFDLLSMSLPSKIK